MAKARAPHTDGIGWHKSVPPPVRGCWYLDRHWDHQSGERTPVGELVYEAKTYGNKLGDRDTAEVLAKEMAIAAAYVADRGPCPLSRITAIIAVPANPPKLPYNLPDILAIAISDSLGVRLASEDVTKVKPSPPAKESWGSALERADSYRTIADFTGQSVLIVDDVVWSGSTLAAVGTVLMRAGAEGVVGYVATRATRGKQRL